MGGLMRRARLVVVSVALAILGAWWWLGRASPEVPDLDEASRTDTSAAAHEPSPAAFDPAEWEVPAASPQQLAIPGGTPALKNPATDDDGHLEIHVSAAARPVEGARVRVYLRGPHDLGTSGAQWRFAGGGATSSDGLLRVAARPGTYLVAVRRDGFATARKEVLRPAGERLTRVEIALESGTDLRGRVVERGGKDAVPLAELALSRFTVPASGRSDSPLEETVFGTADERGRFVVRGLQAGTYHLEVTAVGHGKVERSVALPRPGELVVEMSGASTIEGRVLASDGSPAGGAEVTAVAGDLIRIPTGPEGTFAAEVPPGQLTLTARLGRETGALAKPVSVPLGATVRGLVIQLGPAASLEGVVQEKASHSPVAGARVVLSPFQGEGVGGESATGPDGHFTIEPLPAGSYDVEVQADGYSPFTRRGVTLGAGQSFPLVIELDGTGIVSGTVRDAAGAPAAGILVQAVRMWGTTAFTWGATHEAVTGPDGTYRLPGIEIGRIRVSAGHSEDAWLSQVLVNAIEGQEVRADLTLHETGIVQGRVTAQGGAPLQVDVAVMAIAVDPVVDGRGASVGADGRYRLELPAGRWALRVSPADRPRTSSFADVSVNVQAGATLQRDLELVPEDAPDLLLSGTIFEPSGTPSPAGYVVVTAASAPAFRAATAVDVDGRFS